MPRWTINEVKLNSFDLAIPTSPDALYMWSLSAPGRGWTRSGLEYSKVILLMKHFRVQNPADLAGLSFENEKTDASTAIKYLLTEIKHGGNYRPPTSSEIRREAAKSLARMEVPDFSHIDDETLFQAFYEVWKFFRPDEEWLSGFISDVYQMSGETVVLMRVEENVEQLKFPIVKGPACYMLLIKGNVAQRVVMGPYSTPIDFVRV